MQHGQLRLAGRDPLPAVSARQILGDGAVSRQANAGDSPPATSQEFAQGPHLNRRTGEAVDEQDAGGPTGEEEGVGVEVGWLGHRMTVFVKRET